MEFWSYGATRIKVKFMSAKIKEKKYISAQ